MAVKNMYNSSLASVSPRHLLLPRPNAAILGCGENLPSLVRYLTTRHCNEEFKKEMLSAATW